MRYVLGPSYTRTTPAPSAPASPTGKTDPQVEHVSDDGTTITFRVPAYDLATSNKLMEVRTYFVPEGGELPADVDAYVASAFAFGHADVSGLQTGGDVPMAAPVVDAPTSHAQYVLGYDN